MAYFRREQKSVAKVNGDIPISPFMFEAENSTDTRRHGGKSGVFFLRSNLVKSMPCRLLLQI